MKFVSQNWWGLILLGLFFYWLFRAWATSDYRQFSDVIVRKWQDADFYYGKQGSEFDDLKVRNEIIKRDGWQCQKCKRKVHPTPKTLMQRLKSVFGFWRRLVIDHIIPFIFGGLGIVKNGRVLCWSCNSRRKAKIDRDCLKKVREFGKKIYLGRKVPKFVYNRNKR